MFGFFKQKKYPDFWQQHIKKAKEASFKSFDSIRFVALDTETTGFDYNKDRILCIGAVAIKANKIVVNDSFEVFVKQEVFNEASVKIHGIRRNGNELKVTEEEAIQQFIDYLDDAVLVAHHTKFDVTMIAMALKRMQLGQLRSKQLDTGHLHKKVSLGGSYESNKNFSLDELCDIYNVKKHDRHTALGDALITAYLFLKLTNKYQKNNILSLKNLLSNSYQLGS